jgi:hypothetical protein
MLQCKIIHGLVQTRRQTNDGSTGSCGRHQECRGRVRPAAVNCG